MLYYKTERFEGISVVGITEFADDMEMAVGCGVMDGPFYFILRHFDIY